MVDEAREIPHKPSVNSSFFWAKIIESQVNPHAFPDTVDCVLNYLSCIDHHQILFLDRFSRIKSKPCPRYGWPS